MIAQKKWFILFLAVFVGITIVSSENVFATNSVILYTPYKKIVVPPGESIKYTIVVINNSKELRNEDIKISGMPRKWTYSLKLRGWRIRQLSILPGERMNLALIVNVPYQINKGNYRFKVLAGNSSSLALAVVVSSKGTYETEFTSSQPNMEGSSSDSFTFTAKLKNHTDQNQRYALMADAPPGWSVTFRARYKEVTSVELRGGSAASIILEIKPPSQIEAGKYSIPVSAVTSTTSAKLQLGVGITGSYKMELGTPTGLLSAKTTAGGVKRLKLIVRNTGSSVLTVIGFSADTPRNWNVVFDPKKIDNLLPKKEAQIFATIKAGKKAIPGDYEVIMHANTPETSSNAVFRISVVTSMLWGWIGILIIFVAIGSVYYLFRKYGRR